MFLAKYHRMISYMGYLLGFMFFVLSLVKKRYRLQFFMVSFDFLSFTACQICSLRFRFCFRNATNSFHRQRILSFHRMRRSVHCCIATEVLFVFKFGWTHVTLVIIVTQSHLLMQNMLEGLIWLIVPVSMVICNDIMAYMCGFFFGRTPLIKVSAAASYMLWFGVSDDHDVIHSTAMFTLRCATAQYHQTICAVKSHSRALATF